MAIKKKINKEMGFRLKRARIDQKLTYIGDGFLSVILEFHIKVQNPCIVC